MSGPVARVLEKLDGVKRTRRGALARCPGHQDTRPSLAVDEGDDGRALMTCRAGCRTADILSAIGLQYADLFPPRTGDVLRTAPRPRTLDETDRARRDVLAETRRQQARLDRYREIFEEADSIRICDRVVCEARAVATQLGSREDVLDLLRQAAELDTLTRAAEARLGDDLMSAKAIA
jgi:hypothetical protein